MFALLSRVAVVCSAFRWTGRSSWSRADRLPADFGTDRYHMLKNLRAASIPRAIAEAAVVTAGVALFVAPLYTSQHWLDRHFLPSFFLMRRWYVLVESAVRLA